MRECILNDRDGQRRERCVVEMDRVSGWVVLSVALSMALPFGLELLCVLDLHVMYIAVHAMRVCDVEPACEHDDFCLLPVSRAGHPRGLLSLTLTLTLHPSDQPGES